MSRGYNGGAERHAWTVLRSFPLIEARSIATLHSSCAFPSDSYSNLLNSSDVCTPYQQKHVCSDGLGSVGFFLFLDSLNKSNPPATSTLLIYSSLDNQREQDAQIDRAMATMAEMKKCVDG